MITAGHPDKVRTPHKTGKKKLCNPRTDRTTSNENAPTVFAPEWRPKVAARYSMPAEEKAEKDSPSDTPARLGRLRGRTLIDRMFREGRRINGRTLTIIHLPCPPPESSFAVFVPKRLGKATVRNRTRRALKEQIRTNSFPALTGKHVIILCRQPVGEPFITAARAELPELLNRIPGVRP